MRLVKLHDPVIVNKEILVNPDQVAFVIEDGSGSKLVIPPATVLAVRESPAEARLILDYGIRCQEDLEEETIG